MLTPHQLLQAQPRANSWGFPGRAPRDNDFQFTVSAHRTHFSLPTAPKKSLRGQVGSDSGTLQSPGHHGQQPMISCPHFTHEEAKSQRRALPAH